MFHKASRESFYPNCINKSTPSRLSRHFSEFLSKRQRSLPQEERILGCTERDPPLCVSPLVPVVETQSRRPETTDARPLHEENKNLFVQRRARRRGMFLPGDSGNNKVQRALSRSSFSLSTRKRRDTVRECIRGYSPPPDLTRDTPQTPAPLAAH